MKNMTPESYKSAMKRKGAMRLLAQRTTGSHQVPNLTPDTKKIILRDKNENCLISTGVAKKANRLQSDIVQSEDTVLFVNREGDDFLLSNSDAQVQLLELLGYNNYMSCIGFTTLEDPFVTDDLKRGFQNLKLGKVKVKLYFNSYYKPAN